MVATAARVPGRTTRRVDKGLTTPPDRHLPQPGGVAEYKRCRLLLEPRQLPSGCGETGTDPRNTAAGGLLQRQRLKIRQ